jgi:hypothetical protein
MPQIDHEPSSLRGILRLCRECLWLLATGVSFLKKHPFRSLCISLVQTTWLTLIHLYIMFWKSDHEKPGSWDFTILCTVFRILINAYYSRDVIRKKTFSINLFSTYSCIHIAYMVRVSTTRCKYHPLLYLHSWFLNRNQECFGSTSGSFYRIYVGAFIRRLFNHDLRVERFLKVLQYIIPWNNWLLFLTPQRRT